MLIITPEQLKVFDQSQHNSFILQLSIFLHEEELLDDFDHEDSYAVTGKLVTRAEQLGIFSELGITYYAILASQFGESMQGIADRSWFSVLYRGEDELPDPDWIERVFLTIIDNLKIDDDEE